MQQTFGTTLKQWRAQRRLSQLDLGLSANVSARHISFLETGRAKPSRAMVQHLCEELDVPPVERNAFFNAAGFASAYRSQPLSGEDMAQVREAVDWMLERHDPYPAMALDRHWNLVKANKSAGFMLGATNLKLGDSLLSLMSDKATMEATFENWEEVARHMVARLRLESVHLGGDAILDEAVSQLVDMLGGRPAPMADVLSAVVPARYRAGGQVLSFFSTIAQFGSAQDIALSELKIEMLFPADEKTRAMLQAMAGT